MKGHGYLQFPIPYGPQAGSSLQMHQLQPTEPVQGLQEQVSACAMPQLGSWEKHRKPGSSAGPTWTQFGRSDLLPKNVVDPGPVLFFNDVCLKCKGSFLTVGQFFFFFTF